MQSVVRRHKTLGAWVPRWVPGPCHNPDCEAYVEPGARPHAYEPDVYEPDASGVDALGPDAAEPDQEPGAPTARTS